MSEIKVSKNNYEETVSGSDKPMLLEFRARWCSSCGMFAPIIEEISDEYAGKITVGKVDVDEEPEIAARHRVSSLPTVIFFKGGKAVKVAVGFRPKEDLKRLIEAVF